MLFLAVFCGFLAEYQLEHKIEKDRETKYMRSMIEDLKLDTAELTVHIRLRTERDVMIDSLIFLLTQTNIRENGNSINCFLTRVYV